MNIPISIFFFLIGTILGQQRSIGRSAGRINRFSAPKPQPVNFNCPEDFGYYPHPTDCSQYFVCVFGGALLESCTGGLMYSNDLQTCDWPRNVVCNPSVPSINSVPIVRGSRKKGSGPNAIDSASESIASSASLISRGIDNSLGTGSAIKTIRNSKSIFDETNKIRQGRFITKPQQRRPASFNARFQAQETSSRTFNVFPSSPRPKTTRILFSPSVAVHSTSNRISPLRPTTEVSPLDTNIYNDLLNLTDSDYYYYYDDILYDDYFEPVVTQPPTPKPVIRTPVSGFKKNKPSVSNIQTNSPSRSPQTIGVTPQRSRLVRPSKKPSPVSSRSGLITDIWKYPPRRPNPLYQQPQADVPAARCDPNICVLPDCYCGGSSIPGSIGPQSVPQIVLLTFDDSVNDLNRKLYVELFERGRVNPNGCPISATFYISHEWTDYSQVQNLYSDGHEIASHSITHSFGEKFNTQKWAKEIGGQREIMSAYGGVRMEDIRGMRAPFLAVGGNNMFRMLYDLNFTYDSSMPVYENNPPSWPYTLDYKIFHDCMIPPCPTNSYPGVWQVPMVMWQDLNGGRCSMGDACTTPPDAEGVYKMLIKNFERHYTTNRAPMGLFYHAAWFTTPHHKEGFIAFLDTIASMDDVWLVTNWQALQWVRDPQPLNRVKSFAPFGCDYPERPPRCKSPKVCNVWHKGSVRYLKTCQKCPKTYPWVGNTGVKSSLNNI